MFGDTLTITINAVAKALLKINQDKYSAEYFLKSPTDSYRCFIRHTTYVDKVTALPVDRHNIELVHTVNPVAPDTKPTVRKVYLVLENQTRDTIVDPAKMGVGLSGFLSEFNFTRLINWES